MNDLTEIQYTIGELRTALVELQDSLQNQQDYRKEILKDMKPFEEDLRIAKENLKPYQADLADANVEIANIKSYIKQANELIELYTARLDKVLTEADAVQVFIDARDQGRMSGNVFHTQSRSDAMMFERAMNTIPKTLRRPTRTNPDTEEFEIEILEFPDTYREFLYGEQGVS